MPTAPRPIQTKRVPSDAFFFSATNIKVGPVHWHTDALSWLDKRRRCYSGSWCRATLVLPQRSQGACLRSSYNQSVYFFSGFPCRFPVVVLSNHWYIRLGGVNCAAIKRFGGESNQARVQLRVCRGGGGSRCQWHCDLFSRTAAAAAVAAQSTNASWPWPTGLVGWLVGRLALTDLVGRNGCYAVNINDGAASIARSNLTDCFFCHTVGKTSSRLRHCALVQCRPACISPDMCAHKPLMQDTPHKHVDIYLYTFYEHVNNLVYLSIYYM